MSLLFLPCRLSALAMVPVGNVLSLFRTASSLGHWLASLAREQGHACGARKALAKAATTNERTAMERNIAAIQDVVTWAQMHQTCLRNTMKQIHVCMNITTFTNKNANKTGAFAQIPFVRFHNTYKTEYCNTTTITHIKAYNIFEICSWKYLVLFQTSHPMQKSHAPL